MIAWIKSHAQWIAGGIIAILVAFYLLTHRGGNAAASPGVVSFPAAGGGGGGESGALPGLPPAASSTPTTPTLPYAPDFGVLAAIKDDALRALYEQEYNLETQINQATLQGNDTLIGVLQGTLSDVQEKIKNYAPAPAPSPPAPAPSPVATVLNWFTAGEAAGSSSAARQATFTSLFPDLSNVQVSQLDAIFHLYGSSGGTWYTGQQGLDLVNGWLRAVRAGNGQALIDQLNAAIAAKQPPNSGSFQRLAKGGTK